MSSRFFNNNCEQLSKLRSFEMAGKTRGPESFVTFKWPQNKREPLNQNNLYPYHNLHHSRVRLVKAYSDALKIPFLQTSVPPVEAKFRTKLLLHFFDWLNLLSYFYFLSKQDAVTEFNLKILAGGCLLPESETINNVGQSSPSRIRGLFLHCRLPYNSALLLSNMNMLSRNKLRRLSFRLKIFKSLKTIVAAI